MTKTEIKEKKRNIEIVGSLMNRKMKSFEDKYLGAYMNWGVSDIQNRLAHRIKTNGQVINPEKPLMGVYSNELIIAKLETKLSRSNILALEFLAEAKKGYDYKMTKLIEKLVGFGINYLGLRMEKVGNSGSDFSFLISDDNMEIHARVIFANGEINAPHYRFITTKRDK